MYQPEIQFDLNLMDCTFPVFGDFVRLIEILNEVAPNDYRPLHRYTPSVALAKLNDYLNEEVAESLFSDGKFTDPNTVDDTGHRIIIILGETYWRYDIKGKQWKYKGTVQTKIDVNEIIDRIEEMDDPFSTEPPNKLYLVCCPNTPMELDEAMVNLLPSEIREYKYLSGGIPNED